MRNTISQIVTFLASISTVSLAQHNVTLNNTDSSIKYEGQVGNAILCKVDANGQVVGGQAGCYNVPPNCTSGAAMGMDKNGAASLRFRGSAIYINSLLYDISPLYTVTLDGKTSDIDGVRPSQPFICDSLFSQVGLDPNIDHEIRLSIKGLSPTRNTSYTTGINRDVYLFSLINFIYTAADSHSTTSSSHTPIGPAVGGAVGGVVVILAILFIFFYIRRKRRLSSRRDAVEIDPEPIAPMSEMDRTRHLEGNNPFGSNHSSTNPEGEALSTASIGQYNPYLEASSPQHNGHEAYLLSTALGTPTVSTSTPVPLADVQTSGPSTQYSNSAVSGSNVTPEETRLLNSLYSHDVPAAEIAAMIESMRAARDASTGVQGSSGGVVHRDPGSEPFGPPPEYDFKGK